MRKRLKNKKRSCGMCKPHKRGGANRWTKKENEKLKQWEKDQKDPTVLMISNGWTESST